MSARAESNETRQFDSLPLHDAVLYDAHLEWTAAAFTLAMDAFLDLREPAIPHELTFRGVTDVHIPHEAPWGESTHINSARCESPGRFVIEMQSGDEIRVTAETFEFVPRKA